MRSRPAGAVLATVGLVGLLAGCDPQLAGSLDGPTTIYIEFPDAQDLVHGHTVQIGNVRIGSVRSIELVESEQPGNEGNYAARVELHIVEGREIPLGTTATLRRTSLLGEHFVDLTLPATGGATGPFYESGDTFELEDPACTGTPRVPGGVPSCIVALDDFEDVALNASEVFGAVVGEDLSTIVDEAHRALNGRGQQLNELIADVAGVVGTLADQRADLVATIDGLAALGRTLAPDSVAVGQLIDDLGDTAGLLALHRDRLVTALGELTDLAETTVDTVIEPHAERLQRLLADLDPVVATLAANRQTLDQLVVDLMDFTLTLPEAVSDSGRLHFFAWLQISGLLGGLSAQSAGGPVPVDPVALLEAAP